MKNFKLSEFECTCGCGTNNMCPKHVLWLDYARDIAGVPFIITSGCRCSKHNTSVGGSKTSSHIADTKVKATATDIECSHSTDRWKIVKALIEAGFKRIGIGKDFIHVDSDQRKFKLVIWLY